MTKENKGLESAPEHNFDNAATPSIGDRIRANMAQHESDGAPAPYNRELLARRLDEIAAKAEL